HSLPSHKLLLVDTTEMCLVDSPPGAKYAALSYLWGSVETFKTTKSTMGEVRQPGALARREENEIPLPKTVGDSISLAASLSIAYLWVDCLSICQDDSNALSIYLSPMASIYGNAYVTFVAAQGEDADFGIPGVKNASR
ncbi:HET-domain-containing protein, partial [Lojkania enalia]